MRLFQLFRASHPPHAGTQELGAEAFTLFYSAVFISGLRPCVHESTLHKALALLRRYHTNNTSQDTSLLDFHYCYISLDKFPLFLHYYITPAKYQPAILLRPLQSPLDPIPPSSIVQGRIYPRCHGSSKHLPGSARYCY